MYPEIKITIIHHWPKHFTQDLWRNDDMESHDHTMLTICRQNQMFITHLEMSL